MITSSWKLPQFRRRLRSDLSLAVQWSGFVAWPKSRRRQLRRCKNLRNTCARLRLFVRILAPASVCSPAWSSSLSSTFFCTFSSAREAILGWYGGLDSPRRWATALQWCYTVAKRSLCSELDQPGSSLVGLVSQAFKLKSTQSMLSFHYLWFHSWSAAVKRF